MAHIHFACSPTSVGVDLKLVLLNTFIDLPLFFDHIAIGILDGFFSLIFFCHTPSPAAAVTPQHLTDKALFGSLAQAAAMLSVGDETVI